MTLTYIIKNMFSKHNLIVLSIGLLSLISTAQQNPQFTNYMYNTMTVNPAYAGQRETFSGLALHRSQWVGIEGAPETQTFSVHSPLKNEQIGLGLNVVNDAIGPSNETFVDANFSYTLLLNDFDLKLSLGASAGVHFLNTDWSKGTFKDPDVVFGENVNLISPTVGAGAYLHSRKFYIGLSVPNMLQTKHYDDFQESLATERMHIYLIGGYVFDLSPSVQFKPAFLTRAVSGAPLIVDVSANFWFNEKLTLGTAYRWEDSVSILAGIKLSKSFHFGYAYDINTTGISNYVGGSHEFFLRYELNRVGKILSPRFF